MGFLPSLPKTRRGLRAESQAAHAEALMGVLRPAPGGRSAVAPSSVGRNFDQLSDSSLKELEVARSSAKTPEEKTAVEALARKAYSDTLTPAGNRTAYEDFLSRPREGWNVVLDLNDFKQVNDTYGHAVGDEAVRRAGAAFSEVSRANQGKLFRQGGDEFHAFFATEEQAHAFARQAKAKFEEMAPIRDDHRLSFSAGIGKSPREADLAAAEAKRAKVARYGDARVAADARRGHGESFVRAAGPSPEAKELGRRLADALASPEKGPRPDAEMARGPASLARVADPPGQKRNAADRMPVPPARTVLTIAVISLVLGALGLVGSNPGGEFIRVLLVLAVITLIAGLIQGWRATLIQRGWRRSYGIQHGGPGEPQARGAGGQDPGDGRERQRTAPAGG